MTSVYNEHYVHLVWATWDRLPLLLPDVCGPVYAAIKGKCHDLRCPVQALGGVEDHVHLVVQMAGTVPVSELIKQVKGASSHLVTHVLAPDRFFKWQGGYAVFGARFASVPALVHYVRCQEAHHKNGTLDPDLELPAT